MRSARDFLSGIIDYAGLFPPASLGMREAVSNYAEYVSGPDSDLLGRFVVTASRLDEFGDAAREVLPRGESREPWRLSVIADEGTTRSREAALQFNCGHWSGSEMGHAVCDAIEARVEDAAAVRTAIESFPDFFQLFFEIPLVPDPDPTIAAIAGKRAAAKVRTGGVTPESIPRSTDVLRFLRSCRAHGVPFKATAGLHHAVRGEHPLTYESASPRAEMLGYLNVFVAAAALDAGGSDDEVVAILDERDPGAFRFDRAGAVWRDRRISTRQLEHTRRTFALSYGSCSFTEPVNEARQLGLI
jgi:hypothetical protein